MDKKIKLLFVDDEVRFLSTCAKRLGLREFDVTTATSGEVALSIIEHASFDVALVDLKMPGIGGDELLVRFKRRCPEMAVIILTGHGSIRSAEICTKQGSYRYLQKPCETEELLDVLKSAYWQRVQNRLRLTEEKLAAMLDGASGVSPLTILRRLKEIDSEKGD